MRRSTTALLCLAALAATPGCGPGPAKAPGAAPPDWVPAGYEAFQRGGRFAPSGDPTMDYWARVNLSFAMTRDGPGARDGFAQRVILRAHAGRPATYRYLGSNRTSWRGRTPVRRRWRRGPGCSRRPTARG